ncbi:hypothetical protein TWF696_008437 [Orbilia brochopaga]|uniref:DNA polymerase n=1 Tax=Orbilia brochopaga TaxID=3140254 RepID=A0AAV9UJ44_9PEZI
MPDPSNSPSLYVLPTRLDDTQRATIATNLKSKHYRMTTSARDADVFLGDIVKPKRAALELKFLGLDTTDVTKSTTTIPNSHRLLKVVKLEWYKKAIIEGADANIDDFTVYRGLHIPSDDTTVKPPPSPASSTPQKRPASPPSLAEKQAQDLARRESIMRRAAMGASHLPSVPGTRHLRQSQRPSPPPSPAHKRPRLLLSRESTGSHDEAEEVLANLPPPPLWVTEKQKYACTRSTPASPPPENQPFLDVLAKIRLNRTLQSDEIGVRAYSTAYAAIAAFPHPITHVSQIHALPGCDDKIAALWHEFTHSDPPGRLAVIDEIESSSRFRTLELFYNIWGAGAHTARAFYSLGFRDLDDIVEHHWSHLTRVQQIGVKFYDEFAIKIPRAEALSVRDAVQAAARMLLPGAEAAIVGGFRRGKEGGGDVDLLITHPRVSKSRDVEELLVPLVDKLELEGLITHVLTIHTPSRFVASQSGEVFPKRSHHNFDGIPKVLCVWQQPWDDTDADGDSQMENNTNSNTPHRTKRKNPNPHRRVDILFPPPRCAGSTLTSWSGATTFERDLRRYVRDKNFWKFSSEGITDRATGNRIPIGDERGQFIGLTEEEERSGVTVDDDVDKRGRKPDGEWVGWEIEERKLFKVLGLEWREPTERCTG